MSKVRDVMFAYVTPTASGSIIANITGKIDRKLILTIEGIVAKNNCWDSKSVTIVSYNILEGLDE